jgi:hypothetical protein
MTNQAEGKNMTLEIFHSTNPDAIRDKIAGGYCAVECSIGGESLVGPLKMDHHGPNSHLEGVAVRAYRDHYGERRLNPFFAVTGKPDADATFAIAALIGALPHPSNDITGKPWLAGFDADASALAALVNRMDTTPIGTRLEDEGDEGVVILAFNALASGIEDAIGFYAGVDRWRYLTGRPNSAILSGVHQAEQDRVLSARDADAVMLGTDVAFVSGSQIWGFDVWYADHAPCIVSLAQDGNVTIGVTDTETAEEMFGPGGLKNVFPQLEPEGWGGRESIGGSPRGHHMSHDEAWEAAKTVASLVRN